ncbi:MAG: hypothetical protein KBC35_04425 [Candidatus Pacebacteria bacterium]|nr:hypothetical protein [Candidatus Paceibacterota bacterium]
MDLIQAWRVQDNAPKALSSSQIEMLRQQFSQVELKETPKGTFLFATDENVADDLARWITRNLPYTPVRLTSVGRL